MTRLTVVIEGDGHESAADTPMDGLWASDRARQPDDWPARGRGQDVLEAIANFRRDNDVSPTLREICMAVGIRSTSHADYWLGELERDGLITRRFGADRSQVARGVVLTDRGWAQLGVLA